MASYFEFRNETSLILHLNNPEYHFNLSIFSVPTTYYLYEIILIDDQNNMFAKNEC